MGVGRIFSRGGGTRDFSNFFQGGPKVVKFVFSYSKLKKQSFLLEISNPGPFRRPCLGGDKLKCWRISSITDIHFWASSRCHIHLFFHKYKLLSVHINFAMLIAWFLHNLSNFSKIGRISKLKYALLLIASSVNQLHYVTMDRMLHTICTLFRVTSQSFEWWASSIRLLQFQPFVCENKDRLGLQMFQEYRITVTAAMSFSQQIKVISTEQCGSKLFITTSEMKVKWIAEDNWYTLGQKFLHLEAMPRWRYDMVCRNQVQGLQQCLE